MDSSAVYAAVFVNNASDRNVGLAVVKPRLRATKEDPKTWALYLYDFIDQEHYTGLEAMLVRHAPEHVYLSDVSEMENKKLQQLIEGVPEMMHETLGKGKFADAEAVSMLEKLGGAGTLIDGDEVRGAEAGAGLPSLASRDWARRAAAGGRRGTFA